MKYSNYRLHCFRKRLVIFRKIALLAIISMMCGATTAQVQKLDSILNVANLLTETDFAIPSWTLLRRAVTSATLLKDSVSTTALQKALKNLKTKNVPYSVVMTFNGNPTSRMGFAWYTNVGCPPGEVQLVVGKTSTDAAFATPVFRFYADTTNFNTNYCVSGNNLLALAGIADLSTRSFTAHKALAAGLQPNTTYSYRVGTTGAWSEIGSFTTAKAGNEPFSFIYFTDPQAHNDEMFHVSQQTTHTAKALFPDANFMLNCGDLVDSPGLYNSEWEYEQFFATQQDIWNTTPLVPVIGNHDRSENRNFSRHFNTLSPEFDHTMSTVPGSIYSFVHGDALFMAISFEDYWSANILDSLKTWMTQQVALHQTLKWRIVFFHKTMYTASSGHQSDGDGKVIRDFFVPVFDKLKIDLALQGHDHVYEVIGPLKNNSLVSYAVSDLQTSEPSDLSFNNPNVNGKSGGTYDVQSGTLYFLNNSAGRKKYQPRTETEMNEAATATGIEDYYSFFTGRLGQTGEPTFSNVKVCTDSINIATYTVNSGGTATLFDSFKIIKTPTNITSEKGTGDSILVFPNPAKNYIYVGSRLTVEKMELFDLRGYKTLKATNVNRLNITNVASGLYVLKVKSATEIFVRKVVVQK